MTVWHFEHATSYWWLKIGIAVPGVGRRVSSNIRTAMAIVKYLSTPQIIVRQAYLSCFAGLRFAVGTA